MQKPVSLIHTALLYAGLSKAVFFRSHTKPLCTPITLHYLTTSTKTSDEIAGRQLLMLQTGREYPSLCPSLPSDFYPVGSDFVRFDLQLLFISQNCLHHNNQTHVSCCVTYTCCHHSLWHR